MSSSRFALPFSAGVALLIVVASCSPAGAPSAAQNQPATPPGQPSPTRVSVASSTAAPNLQATIAAAVQATLTAQPAPTQAPVASSTATPNLQATIAAAVQATLTAQPVPPAPTVAFQPPTAQPGQTAILGKWEVTRDAGPSHFISQVSLIYEFFDDGTVSAGPSAGKYSWVQGNRLKIDYGLGSTLITVKQNGDNMDWTDSAGQATSLQRYQELVPTPQALAGTWQLAGAVQPNCMKAFGQQLKVELLVGNANTTPWIKEITFDASGTFIIVPFNVVSVGAYSNFNTSGPLYLRGSYSVQGHGLGLHAVSVASHLSANALLNCEITLSHTRLSFRDTPVSDPLLFFMRKAS